MTGSIIGRGALALFCAAYLSACASSHAPSAQQNRRHGELANALSREIERMLEHHERLATRSDAETRGHGDAETPGHDDLASNFPDEQPSLVMPVAGVRPRDLQSNFGDARPGGRHHQGIDIFAPRWTEVVAVSSGYVSFVGVRPLAGRCLWLTAHDGSSYFYAHLEAWADSLWEGKPVEAGELLGFVGNSGNASGSSPHLHFEMHQYGAVVDPYPLLTSSALRASRPDGHSRSEPDLTERRGTH